MGSRPSKGRRSSVPQTPLLDSVEAQTMGECKPAKYTSPYTTFQPDRTNTQYNQYKVITEPKWKSSEHMTGKQNLEQLL